jgi:dTDP-glucose 4,6-dehydratase
VTNKHLLPVGNYPMIYHPIARLKQAGITDILIVTGRDHLGDVMELLGSGHDFGLDFTYKVQDQADVADRPAVETVFAQYHPTLVVHFAAESHVDRSIDGPDVVVRTNVLGTQVLLDVARRQWQQDACMDTARFLYISTDEVYGDLPIESTEKFTEDSPLRPSSPYSVAKAAGDLMAQAYHRTYGMPTLITRSSNNYGPRQYPEKPIPLTIKRALAGEPIPVYGDGRNVRDWLYVEDNCHAIDLVLRKGAPGAIYNVGGGNELSNIDLVHLLLHLLAEQTGKPEEDYTHLITFVPDRPGHDRRYALDSSRVADLLKQRMMSGDSRESAGPISELGCHF